VLLVHTGQHYDRQMSDAFFEELEMPRPHIQLGAGSGSHAEQTARVMVLFEQVCLAERPDWVVVVGDINSTLACALAAKKLNIAVAHVEAGLRSGDRAMPEEINRLCTDAISDLLFTTDRGACDNLLREGIPAERIHFVGNTMIDTLLRHIGRARAFPLPDGVEAERFALVTLHRPSNVDHPAQLGGICDALGRIAGRLPVVFPVHPRTRARLDSFGLTAKLQAADSIRLIEPLSYLPFVGLAAHSRMVLTDSGGIQEETTVLGVPCITMRDNTERPITCEAGTNVLAGSDPGRVCAAAFAALETPPRKHSIPEKWDGRAAERILPVLLAGVPA
jgi:UDP-N-acetylglucosamine 2-epimerase (non-hydrolysing)